MTEQFNHVPVKLPELKTTTINHQRFYITPKENYYPSITTVLSIRKKEGLMEWRKRVGDDVANYVARTAAARGTKVHHMCEDYLNNQHIEWPDKWKRHKKDFLPWCLFDQLRDKVLCNISDIYAQECALYSDKYKVELIVLQSIMVFFQLSTLRHQQKNALMIGTKITIFNALHMQKCLLN